MKFCPFAYIRPNSYEFRTIFLATNVFCICLNCEVPTKFVQIWRKFAAIANGCSVDRPPVPYGFFGPIFFSCRFGSMLGRRICAAMHGSATPHCECRCRGQPAERVDGHAQVERAHGHAHRRASS